MNVHPRNKKRPKGQDLEQQGGVSDSKWPRMADDGQITEYITLIFPTDIHFTRGILAVMLVNFRQIRE